MIGLHPMQKSHLIIGRHWACHCRADSYWQT